MSATMYHIAPAKTNAWETKRENNTSIFRTSQAAITTTVSGSVHDTPFSHAMKCVRRMRGFPLPLIASLKTRSFFLRRLPHRKWYLSHAKAITGGATLISIVAWCGIEMGGGRFHSSLCAKIEQLVLTVIYKQQSVYRSKLGVWL